MGQKQNKITMEFYELNLWFWQLPEIVHIITFAFLVACYTHLLFGFWLHRGRIPLHVKKYFISRALLYIIYMFAKSEDLRYGMFDLFLPIYVLGYIDGLIILNGFGFYRCKNFAQAVRKIFRFQKL